MSLFRRIAVPFLCLSYAAVSFAGFFAAALAGAPGYGLERCGYVFLSWALLWIIFGRPAWFHGLLLPVFLALPVELYLLGHYRQGLTAHHLGILLETTPAEAAEFLGDKCWIVLGVGVGSLLWWLLSGVVAYRTSALTLRRRVRLLWILAFFVAAMSIWFLPSGRSKSAQIGEGGYPGRQVLSWASEILKSAGRREAFAGSLPLGLWLRFWELSLEREYLERLSRVSGDFAFGANQHAIDNRAQVVVMVIGESSRFDRWSLNGYERVTNPLLSREKNLVSLTDLITPVSATRLSVPVMVSRKSAKQSLQAGFSEKSFLSAFKEAGFKTFWLSNQMSFGEFDTPISVFAKEADVARFYNFGSYDSSPSFDESLLAPLRVSVRDPAPKKLIVLHTLGSHWNYSHRYPESFDNWRPSLFGISNPAYTDIGLKEALNNSYDNSVLYTDWFLSEVIGALKEVKAVTSLVYVADHGQTLYDGSCKIAFHGHNTDFEFHVPAVVWFSDAYLRAFPRKVRSLLKNRRSPISTENVFHSLVDMADIRYATEQLEWSVFSSQWRPHRRFVDSYGWTDYDDATRKGDCREIVRDEPAKKVD